MKFSARLALVLTVFTTFYTQSNAQIDPSWEYFHYRTDGTRVAGAIPNGVTGAIPVDIRLTNYEFGPGVPNNFYLTEGSTFSFRRDNAGNLTNTYHAMAGFNSATWYTEGRLMSFAYNERLRMNYRLIKPKNYPTNPNVEGGYPLIVMTHGFGERANCWGSNCYWSNAFWNTTDNNPQAVTFGISAASGVNGNSPTTFTTVGNHNLLVNQQVVIRNSTVTAYNGTRTITAVTANTFTVNINFSGTTSANVSRTGVFELLNNDHSMTHGGNVHQTAVHLSTIGTKVPDDPTMPARAFPGFVLFPQNLNGWEQGGAENVVRIIRLLMQTYNINPNKIYVHGLSDGGSAVYRLVRTAPWLFAAALPMSAVNNPENNYPIYQHFNNIPLWVFQGGVDTNPNKTTTEQLIQNFRNAGMNVRYTLYPTLGHGVWNNAYNEPDFFSWMRTKDKSQIFVKFGNATVCGTSGAAAEMILSQGFLAYQWERDGEIIPGANAYNYFATLPGTYRARFSRVANPGETDWNRWSDPMVITESAPPTPVIQTIGSPVMPTINPAVWPVVPDLVLKSSEDNEKYYWYRDGVLVTNARTYNNQNTLVQDTLSMIYRSYEHPGSYTLKTAGVSTCQSLPSAPLQITYLSPTSITLPGNFNGIAQSPTSIFLTWADNSPNESGFEIWRRTAGENTFTYVGVTEEDAISYLDTELIPGTLYEYKLRAVSNTARSLHVPSEDLNNNLEVETPLDEAAPTAPQNLRVTLNSINSISLAWDTSTDNGGINQYVITYGVGNPLVYVPGNETTFTLTGLPANTAYPITLQAEDFGGNLSTPSNQVIGTTFVEGLYYDHSTGAWATLDPVESTNRGESPPIDWITAEFTGKINNFNVNPMVTFYGEPPGIATQEDFYKIKFDGYILIPTFSPVTSGNVWQFRTTSDDGSMLYTGVTSGVVFNPANVTTNRRVNNDGLHGPVTVESGNVTLAPGYHRIVVLFNEYTGGQSLTVEYRRRLTSAPTWTAWTPIPDAMLRSGNFVPPAALAAPTSLVASANGMTNIDLTWVYGGSPSHEFEVYRATAIDGEYSIVGRGTGLAFTDETANPSTTYYYKLKTINVSNGASSPFSLIANATTASDAIAPSIPTDITFISKTFSNVAFSWSASTDNVAVTGYEILANGNPIGVSTVTSYSATNLEPGTLYNFTVKAFDAIGNKSAASDPLAVTTNAGVMFYSKPSGALSSAATWGTELDGTGTAPNLTYNGQYYMVANRASTGLGGAPLTIGGSISKVIVPTGTTLTVDNTISAKLEVQGNAVVNLNNSNTAPEFLSVSPASTVNFNNYAYIPAGTYGHVNLSGTGNKNFAEGETVIMGNLTATTGIALKGVPGNTSHVTVHGDITLAGTPAIVATDNALDLTLAKAGTQTLTVNGALDLYKLSTASGTNVNAASSSPITLNVGSPNGGGLVLANGTTLNLGNNHLVLKNAATINAGGQTGKLAINGSNLTLSSSSTQNSNLHFDATLKTAGLVTSTFSSTGKLMIQSPVTITDGLKIKAGEVSSAGNITLASTQTKTAYLQELEGNGSITGNAKVERWVSAVRKYRYMSSVVDNMTVAMWQAYMPITGPFTGTSSSNTPSAFYYVETNNPAYINFPHTGSDNSVTFQRGRGYSIFNYNGNNPLTLTMTGNPYQGSVPFTLTPGSGGNTGWNLVGNPYASAIQWNNLATDWTRTGVATSIAVPDNATGTLVQKTYDSQTGLGTLTGGIIAPGQAFWVQTTGAATMTIHEKAKRTTTSTFYREGDAHINSITIRLSNGTAEDVGYVILGKDYSDTYEPETDGMKYKNQVLNVSTRSSENVNLVFNKLSDSFCEKTVALVLEDVTPGTYSLSFDNIENLVGVGAVALTDHFTNTTLAITNSTPYSFAVTTAASSFGAGRFSITLNRPALQKNAIASVANLCGGTSATIQLTNTQPGAFYYATRVNEETPISEIVASETGTQLTIPVSALQAGANSVVIHTGFTGCSDELLTATPLVFNYTPSPVVAVEKPFFSLCAESQINLKAETNSANSLHWYKDGVLIANQTSANWISDPLKKTTLFEVAAVSNGCEGPKTSVYIEINRVEMPIVEFTGKNLEIVNEIPADNFIQWYINGSPLDAYDKGITPEEEGIYTVLVAKGGCSIVSDPFEYLVTGVENPLNEPFNVYVYPNPATFDQLYVKLETTSKQNATVTLVDLAGRTAFTQSINGSEGNGVHKLNVAQDTAPGLYIMQIQQGDAVVQRKVIIQFK